MWSQLVKMRLQPGKDGEMTRIEKQWEEQIGRGPDSGWAGTRVYRSERDPAEWYILVTFESEDKARANEQSPRHQAVIEQFNALMDGQPEYVDLIPVQESQR